MTRIAILILLTSVISSAYGENLPRFPKNTDYWRARQLLMALGYKPLRLPDADECDSSTDRTSCFPERESCSGTGRAPCIFVWQKGEAIIQVNTVGDPPVIVTVTCNVNCN
jgi:hypothetical protein